MAIIYSYPGKSPVASNDTVVITDSSGGVSPANATKSATMSTIASYVINDSGNSIPLQRVLNDGATATPENQAWNGTLALSNGTSGDEVTFSVASSSGSPANRLLFNTDNALPFQLQVTGGVEVTSEGVNKVTIDKASGNLVVDGRFAAGGASIFENDLDVTGVLTLNDGDLVIDKSVNNQTITAAAGKNITITGPEGITLQTTKSVNDDILIDAANGSAIGGNLTMYGKTVELKSIGNGGNMVLQSQYQPGAAATGLHLQTTGANSIIKIESNQDDVQIVAPTGNVNIGTLTQ